MDCKIMKKEAFTVLCRAKTFKYEDAVAQVPQFWAEHFAAGGGKVVCGMYGINLDESMGGNEFEYLIADNYDPAREIPDGFTTRTIGGVIMTLASLSFLGLGAQSPTPEWGLMINVGRTYFQTAWWISIFPGLAIFLTVLVFNLLGDGLREVLDPKTRKL